MIQFHLYARSFWTILHLLQMQIYYFFNLLFTFALLLLVLNFLAVEALAHIVIVVICFGVPGFNCNKRYLT